MNDLEVCKAIAELECAKWESHLNTILVKHVTGTISINGVPHMTFNPITDLALNCILRDKHEVNIEYCTQFDCGIDGNGDFDIPYVTASIKDQKGAHSMTPLNDCSSSSICRAVCECILKSKGKYGRV